MPDLLLRILVVLVAAAQVFAAGVWLGHRRGDRCGYKRADQAARKVLAHHTTKCQQHTDRYMQALDATHHPDREYWPVLDESKERT